MKLKEMETDAKVVLTVMSLLVILCIVLCCRVNKLEKEKEEMYNHFISYETKMVMTKDTTIDFASTAKK